MLLKADSLFGVANYKKVSDDGYDANGDYHILKDKSYITELAPDFLEKYPEYMLDGCNLYNEKLTPEMRVYVYNLDEKYRKYWENKNLLDIRVYEDADFMVINPTGATRGALAGELGEWSLKYAELGDLLDDVIPNDFNYGALQTAFIERVKRPANDKGLSLDLVKELVSKMVPSSCEYTQGFEGGYWQCDDYWTDSNYTLASDMAFEINSMAIQGNESTGYMGINNDGTYNNTIKIYYRYSELPYDITYKNGLWTVWR